MYQTQYHRPSTVEEAASLLASSAEAKLLAGGQTLVPTMKARLAAPETLIDLRHIASLKGVKVVGQVISIGAATSHAEVAGSAEIKSACAALADLASHIGDPHVRHMGTLGGSVANNDPAADYPAAVLALRGKVNTSKRIIEAEEFFQGLFETALAEDEIITSIDFEAPSSSAYAKFPNPASRYAMCGVFVARFADGEVRVAVTGAGADGVFRHGAMEMALSGNFSAAALDGISTSADNLLSDIHGGSDYRANLVGVMAKRAVEAAG